MAPSSLFFLAYAASALGAAVNSTFSYSSSSYHSSSSPFVTTRDLLPTYDYVVVGSGPGGGPLASRLARAGKRVLLIEAGDDQGDSDLYRVPGLQLNVGEDPEMRWSYFVEHYSDRAQQIKDTKLAFTTGKNEYIVGEAAVKEMGIDPPIAGILYPRAGTLGGCGSHNAMITTTPFRKDWDTIASITGDSSWSSDDMLKYFVRLENNTYLPAGTPGHGFDGWLSTSLTDLSFVLPDMSIQNVLTGAARALGMNVSFPPPISDFSAALAQDMNSPDPSRDQGVGLFQVPMAVKEGVRNGPRDFVLSTALAKDAYGRRKYHLDIMLNTLATQVTFDVFSTILGKPRANGVRFSTGKSLYGADPRSTGAQGKSGFVRALKEVIVSAGTFNTPQLLKLSGIGPRDELTRFGIRTLVDLPGLGTNMQDRYETTMNWETSEPLSAIANCTFGRPGDKCLEEWKSGTSPSTQGIYSSNGAPLGIILKSSQAAPTDDPDLFMFAGTVDFRGYFPGYSQNGTADSKHWTWGVLKARSRNHAGTVQLRSTNPQDTPVIQFNSFAQGGDKDAAAVAEGLKFIRDMHSKIAPGHGNWTEVWPGKEVEDLETFARNEAWGHHACCTAKIGADDDKMAVLDSEFRVRGTKGLRVVDASIFPDIPNWFISTSIYMASEKAADAILSS
ncbi:hypothetical protein TD95_004216 [Thielaviopsis punctulata]|uniref:Glucose-methanol-choline oxidoreductase N-terminal domain-containing protein n=1 Tax=Thielaviopsis punctulata TaxID=72032 RepID=A0A0F4ZKJ0_9PEZI|nr:hypothetical protein TD95_004216 [Thielaviopsis punctulata]